MSQHYNDGIITNHMLWFECIKRTKHYTVRLIVSNQHTFQHNAGIRIQRRHMRPVELRYLGKLESACPSFDCQQPNLIGSGPTTKVAAANHLQIIRDYIYKCEP